MTNRKATYFVTKHNDVAKATIGLLTERLDSEEWEVTTNTHTVTQVYRQRRSRRILSYVSLNLTAPSYVFLVDGKYVTLAKYLSAEQRLTESEAVLERILNVREHKYMLPGTAQRVSFLSSEEGVYLVANCSDETHTMLSEYYVLSNDPETLYSAVDESGDLWELTEGDFDDDLN